MKPTITAFAKSPDQGAGLARDMHVRWALEEVGQDYDVRLVPWAEMKEPQHRAIQPFGQIPTFEEGDLALFESGAIVLHIAETLDGLLPSNPDARARAIMWMFCAVSTIEPPVVDRDVVEYLEDGKSWQAERAAMVDERVRGKLRDLSARLGSADWLDGDFTAGDLMMVEVLRRLAGSGLLEEFPNIAAYVARGEARPAFKRAFAAQKKVAEEAKTNA